MQKFKDLFAKLTPENQEKVICFMEVLANPKITIYFTDDRKAVIRWPKDCIPDTETVERVSKILNEYAAQMR